MAPIDPLNKWCFTIAQLLFCCFPERGQHGILELGTYIANVAHLPIKRATMVVETGSVRVNSFLGGPDCSGSSSVIKFDIISQNTYSNSSISLFIFPIVPFYLSAFLFTWQSPGSDHIVWRTFWSAHHEGMRGKYISISAERLQLRPFPTTPILNRFVQIRH